MIAAAFQLFDGMQAVAAGALRGLQDTRVPMWIAIFAYWVPGFGIALALGFATPLEGSGVWIGLAVGLVRRGDPADLALGTARATGPDPAPRAGRLTSAHRPANRLQLFSLNPR